MEWLPWAQLLVGLLTLAGVVQITVRVRVRQVTRVALSQHFEAGDVQWTRRK